MLQTSLFHVNNRCATRLVLLKQHPSLKRRCAVKTRLSASSVPDKATSTIGSIDNLLGSRDDEEQVPVQQDRAQPIQLLRVPGWAWSELREPRVIPAASTVLYYLLLVVYTSYYVVQLAEGQEVADDLLARLVNDHTAVAAGDTVRLFTSFFVADSPAQLVISLVGLATIAAELESILGYSTFWAVWCVTVLAGGLADAALSTLPITAGPAAGVGGAAAALLAHHLHNWRVEQLLAQAKSGEVPEAFMQLEHQFNRQQRLAAAGRGDASSSSVSASSSSSSAQQEQLQQQQQPWGGSIGLDDGLVETELEGPVGLSVNLMLPREGKAFVTLGGTAVAVISALKDAADTDATTDWTALVAAFLVGGVLGWLACPVYSVKLVPASLNSRRDVGRRSMASYDEQESSDVPADLLLPVLYDVRPWSDRANAVVGAAALLFAAVGVWLTTQGLFV